MSILDIKMTFFKYFKQRVEASLFLQNVFTLATGTTLAQAVSIFTAPILYRIYDREDYGTLSLYMAIVAVIGVFSTLQYQHAILLEKKDDKAKVAMLLNRIINFVVALLTFFIILAFGEQIAAILGNKKIITWLYLAPISIFFIGQGQIFSIWANRKKKYRVLTYNMLLTAILVPLVSISIGIYNNGPFGLFMGLLVSQALPSIILLLILSKEENFGLQYFQISDFKELIKKYQKFTIFSLPSELINRVSNQLPVLMLSSYLGPSVVGLYSLSVRMLGLPITLIGNAISTVFRQRASEDYFKTGSFRRVFLKTLKTLSTISIIPLFITILAGPQLFGFVFGENWKESGVISQIMIFYFALKLVVSPLSYAIIIKNKPNIGLIKDMITMMCCYGVFHFGFIFELNYLYILLVFSAVYSLLDLIYLMYLNHLSREGRFLYG